MLNGLFSMDGPIYKFGSLVYDLFVLNVLWLFFSIIGLGFTMGASTAALFYVAGKRVRGEDGYLVRDFWKSFKMNLKQGVIIWVILLIVYWVLLTNINAIRNGLLGSMGTFMYPLQLVVLIEVTIMGIYIFPLLSRFHMTVKNFFKTAFFMANKHFITTILSIFAFVGMGLLMYYVHGIFILFYISGYALWVSYMLERVFKKYIPEDLAESKNYGEE